MNGATIQRVRAAVGAVDDPELPGVTLDDLGILRDVTADDGGRVVVTLRPTFLGCSALHMIRADVHAAAAAAVAAAAESGAGTAIEILVDPSDRWSTDLITAAGRRHLAAIGIAVPGSEGASCPFCGSASLRPLAPVGAGTCRASSWCDGCRSVVEVMRDPGSAEGPSVPLPRPTRRSYAHV